MSDRSYSDGAYGYGYYGSGGIPPASSYPRSPQQLLGDGLWTFEIADSATMTKIGELTQARSRSLQLGHNAAGAWSMNLPLKDDLSYLATEVATCVVAKIGGQIVWSGPMWTGKETTPDSFAVTAVGWLQTLEKRVIKPLGVSRWPSWEKLSYSGVDAGKIALSLLSQSNGDSAYADLNYVVPGSAEPSQPRTRTYQPWASLLGSITDLSQVEDGYDLLVDPVTRELNIYRKLGVTRPDVVFEYGNNLASVSRDCDASRMCNRMIAYSSVGFAVSEDIISQRVYGTFEEAVSLTGVVDVSILQAYANAEVAVRSTPQRFVGFQPRQYSSAFPNDPRLFRDFNISDTITLKARRGRIQVPSQQVRVFGATISFSDNGQEQLTSLQTTFTS